MRLQAQQKNLETRQAQLFMQIYSYWYTPDFWRHWDNIMRIDFKGYDEYMEKTSPEINASNRSLFAFFEGLGVLVKRGLIEPSFIDDLMSAMVVSYWDKMRLFWLDYRVKRNAPMAGEWIEYLFDAIRPIMETQHPEMKEKQIIWELSN